MYLYANNIAFLIILKDAALTLWQYAVYSKYLPYSILDCDLAHTDNMLLSGQHCRLLFGAKSGKVFLCDTR